MICIQLKFDSAEPPTLPALPFPCIQCPENCEIKEDENGCDTCECKGL